MGAHRKNFANYSDFGYAAFSKKIVCAQFILLPHHSGFLEVVIDPEFCHWAGSRKQKVREVDDPSVQLVDLRLKLTLIQCRASVKDASPTLYQRQRLVFATDGRTRKMGEGYQWTGDLGWTADPGPSRRDEGTDPSPECDPSRDANPPETRGPRVDGYGRRGRVLSAGPGQWPNPATRRRAMARHSHTAPIVCLY